MKYAEVFSRELNENGEIIDSSLFKVRVGKDGKAEFFDINNDYWVEEFTKDGFYTPAAKDVFTIDNGKEFVEALVKYFSGSYYYTLAN